jgi:light-regulated signal transduction histidine kinase (bacteriophytochrome)
VAVAAHGLLTPMAVIKGFAETLLQRWTDFPAEERNDYLTRIMVNADLATARLRDLAVGLPPEPAVPAVQGSCPGPTTGRRDGDR